MPLPVTAPEAAASAYPAVDAARTGSSLEGRTEVLLDGFIDPNNPQGSALGLRSQLQAAAGQDVVLRIHSPGGSVDEANALFNLIQGYSGHVLALIDALAASAATYVMLAADEVWATENARIMIHLPTLSGASGTADEVEQMAKTLRDVENQYIESYAARTGERRDNVRKSLLATTWYTAKEAKRKGFVNRILKGGKRTNAQLEGLDAEGVYVAFLEQATAPSADSEQESWLQALRRQVKEAVASVLPSPLVATAPPLWPSAPSPSSSLTSSPTPRSMNLQAIAQQLNLPADATPEQISAHLQTLLEGVDLAAANCLKVEALQKEVDAYKAAEAQRQEAANKAQAAALVEAALKAGKILPVQKDSFLALAQQDYANAQAVLENLRGYQPLAGQAEPEAQANEVLAATLPNWEEWRAQANQQPQQQPSA